MPVEQYVLDHIAGVLRERSEGTVTLTRSTDSTPDAPTPGTITTAAYTLDAVVRGAAQYADGTTVLATDVVVVASPKARDGSGNVVDLVPQMSDTITVGGTARRPKRIEPVPASGPPAKFRIFVAS